MKTPPATFFIKQAAGVTSGSQKPGHQTAATISLKHLHGIAEIKQKDAPAVPLESIVKSLIGTCRAMGIKVVGTPTATSTTSATEASLVP